MDLESRDLRPYLALSAFFFYKTGEFMLDVTVRPFIITQVRASLCSPGLSDNCSISAEQESVIQSTSATYIMLNKILVSIPAVPVGLACGAWSDKNGRKQPIIFSVAGSVLSVILYPLSEIFPNSSLGLILAAALIQGLSGKSSVITMALNSYISDTSDTSDRTKWLGLLLAMHFIGFCLGSLLSGLLEDLVSEYTSFCVASAFHTVSLLVVIFCLEESICRDSEISYSSVLSLSALTESVRVLFKERQKVGKRVVLILFFIDFVNQTCKSGDLDLTALYVQGPPFYWKDSLFGYLMSTDYAVLGSGLLFIVPSLTSYLTTPDLYLIILGILSKLTRCLWRGLASDTWLMYTSTVSGVFSGCLTPEIRSILSKQIDKDEVGKLFSLLSSEEMLAAVIGAVLFPGLYKLTLGIFPAFGFLLEALFFFLILIMVMSIRGTLIALNSEKSCDLNYQSFSESEQPQVSGENK